MTFKKIKSHKNSFYLELTLFLVLGFLLGAVIKVEAIKRVTIGFNDYEAPALKQGYDFSQIQKDLNTQDDSASEGNANGEQIPSENNQ